MIKIAERLEKLLEDEEKTIQELSEITGIKYNTLRDLVKGTTTNPKIDTLKKLSDATNISIMELLYGEKAGRIEKIVMKISNLDEKEEENILTMLEGATYAVSEKRRRQNAR